MDRLGSVHMQVALLCIFQLEAFSHVIFLFFFKKKALCPLEGIQIKKAMAPNAGFQGNLVTRRPLGIVLWASRDWLSGSDNPRQTYRLRIDPKASIAWRR